MAIKTEPGDLTSEFKNDIKTNVKRTKEAGVRIKLFAWLDRMLEGKDGKHITINELQNILTEEKTSDQ